MMRTTCFATAALALAGCNLYSGSTSSATPDAGSGSDGATHSHTDPGTVAIDLTFAPGWVGTVEVLVHDAGGALVARRSLGVHTDVAIVPPQTITIAAESSAGVVLGTYYGLGGGDTLAVAVGSAPADATRSVTVSLPGGVAADTRFASGPSAEAQGPSTDLTLYVPQGRSTVPMIGAAISGPQVVAMYADAAVDVSGTSAALDHAVPVDEVAVDPGTVPIDAMVTVSGQVEVGRDVLFTPDVALGASNRTVHFAHGFADRDDVTVAVASNGAFVESVASYEGTPAATFDVGALPIAAAAVSGASFDGTRFAWTAGGGDHALELLWYFEESSNARYLDWSFQAPPDQPPPVIPILPADLAPTAPWNLGGMFSYAGDFATDYYDLISRPALTGHGTYYWQLSGVPMTLPGQVARPLSASGLRGHTFSRSQVAQ